jgi:acylphosphatase
MMVLTARLLEKTMTTNESFRLHAIVSGRVQGVGFRAFVEQTAANLGLVGWVRNRWNGEVEVLAEGNRSTLDKLLAALWRGPTASRVTQVSAEWQPATGEFDWFFVRSTA